MLVAKLSQVKLIHIQKKGKKTRDVYTLYKFSNRELVATHARHFCQGFFLLFFYSSVVGEESNWKKGRNGWLYSRVFSVAIQQVPHHSTGECEMFFMRTE